MRVINLSNLLQSLKSIDDYIWIQFEIDGECKTFITVDVDGMVRGIDDSEKWYYENFKKIIQYKFNSKICSPPLEILQLQGTKSQLYFTLNELLKWDFLKQYKSMLLNIEEDIILEDTVSINENEVNELLNINNIDENLKNKLLKIKYGFDELHSK